ncbi:hypothetical protein [Pseudomonas aeruginosa]|uniref:hypothetical protein n=1 Tax=Pseudomonas aeruginosa TaxID=287 RepID=UPI003D7FEB0E
MSEEKVIKGKAKGGKARAESMTQERRKAIAKAAAEARWAKKTSRRSLMNHRLPNGGEVFPWEESLLIAMC